MVIITSMMLAVAFYTILERKILSYIQIRKGPNKVGYMGMLQPFSDGLKLFNKNLIPSENMNYFMSFTFPSLSLLIMIMILPIINYNNLPLYDIKHNILMFFILSSMAVYFILIIGWSSNSKYSHMGAIRSVAQMISYEVSFFLIILFISIMSYSYSFQNITQSQNLIPYFLGNMILFFMWLITCMAETNRSPFDFAEGESELVSGFNIDYMGGWFTFIFLAEYMSMLILSMITIMMFFSNIMFIKNWIFLIMITIMFLWIRGSFPRFRYDILMKLSWKIFLPITIFSIIISMNFTYFNL